MDEQTTKRDLIRVCHLMYERSYVVSSDGNVSVRLDDGRIIATPTMTCKGRMTEDLLAVTDLEGRSMNDRRASSELAMHLLIYRDRPDVKAVCHAHPPHGTAFAVAGLAREYGPPLFPARRWFKLPGWPRLACLFWNRPGYAPKTHGI